MLKNSTFIVLAVIFGFKVTAKADDGVKNDVKKFSVSLNQFAVDLLRVLSKPENNIIVSPISLATILAMLQQIMTTKPDLEELEKALHLTAEESKTGFHRMIQMLNKNEHGNSTVRLGNGCVVKNDNVALSDDLIKTIATYFNTKVRKDSFKDLAASAKRINDEIAKATNHLITDMIKADDLKDSLAVLYSAIYFKAFWVSQFPGVHTAVGSFHINDQKVIQVPTMYEAEIKATCGNDTELGMQWIKLKYKDSFNGPSYSMLLALPLKRFGLDDLIQKTALNLTKVVAKGHYCQGIVRLPKFTLKEKINCQETLEKLGVSSIFKASNGVSLKVSKILHDAFISVAEKGTEAAAATSSLVYKSSASDLPYVNFNADQPFLFAVMNNQLKVPLFIGKIVNPEWKLVQESNTAASFPKLNGLEFGRFEKIAMSGISDQIFIKK